MIQIGPFEFACGESCGRRHRHCDMKRACLEPPAYRNAKTERKLNLRKTAKQIFKGMFVAYKAAAKVAVRRAAA